MPERGKKGGLHGKMLSYLSVLLSGLSVRGSVLVQIQTAGCFAPTAVFWCLSPCAGGGADIAPPRCAERRLFSFTNIVCRRIRTWLPGLSLLHGGEGDSHPA